MLSLLFSFVLRTVHSLCLSFCRHPVAIWSLQPTPPPGLQPHTPHSPAPLHCNPSLLLVEAHACTHKLRFFSPLTSSRNFPYCSAVSPSGQRPPPPLFGA
eukprot:5647558-Pleurochrysis_carterae.AAC.1